MSRKNTRVAGSTGARRLSILAPSKPPALAVPVASTTAERILGAGIELFNQHGIQNVAMSRIAAQVGISAGNLGYHFKSKRDMLVAILPMIEEGMLAAIRVPPSEVVSPVVVAHWQIGIFRYLWKFRFFFTSLTYVFPEDEELRDRYAHFEQRIIQKLQAVLDNAVERKLMRPVDEPNTTELVATNMWLLWLAWLRCEQIRLPRVDSAENTSIYKGALLHFSLTQPYFGREFRNQLLESIGIALGKLPRDSSSQK